MEILDKVLEAMRERDKTTERVDQLAGEKQILLQTLYRINELDELKFRLCKEALRQNDLVVSLQRLQERFENGERTSKREHRRPNH